jgi:sugar phosphate permease
MSSEVKFDIKTASARGESTAVSELSYNMFLGVLPTLVFLLVAWLAARAGWRLGSIIITGYAAWGVGLLILITVKRLFSVA